MVSGAKLKSKNVPHTNVQYFGAANSLKTFIIAFVSFQPGVSGL